MSPRAPYLKTRSSVAGRTWGFMIAALPVIGAAVFTFHLRACGVFFLSAASCLGAEFLAEKMLKKRPRLGDGSAFATGFLLAFLLPAGVPWWVPVAGGFFAILIGREIFGGLGQNIFNPAMLAHAFLLAMFPAFFVMEPYDPQWQTVKLSSVIGGASQAAVLIGGIFLIWQRLIPWRMSFYYLGTLTGMSWLLGREPSQDLLIGGSLLAAFFYVPDTVASPVTEKGRAIFACGSAVIAMILRFAGGHFAEATYGVLFMNAVTPLLDHYFRARAFGEGKKAWRVSGG